MEVMAAGHPKEKFGKNTSESLSRGKVLFFFLPRMHVREDVTLKNRRVRHTKIRIQNRKAILVYAFLTCKDHDVSKQETAESISLVSNFADKCIVKKCHPHASSPYSLEK